MHLAVTLGDPKMKSHPHPRGVPSLREWVETGKLYGRHCDGEEHGCGHIEPPFCARPHIGQRHTPPSRCPHFSWRDEMSMSWGTQPVASELRAECGPDRRSLLCVAEEEELGWAVGHQATFPVELAFSWTSKAGFGQLKREVGLLAGEEAG